MRILLVDDDESIVAVLASILNEQNYVVDVATDGEDGWELAESVSYDLVLLDVMLPRLDGISFCRRLRQKKSQVLVMLLTARDKTTDKMLGLDSGADDYVVKPFDAQEVVARIRALLRRGNTATSPILTCGDLYLDPSTREVTYSKQLLRFSRKEYLLLELFLRNQQRVFSRGAIVDQLWSFSEDPPNEDTVKSHIKSIRRKLDKAGAGDLIETLYGQGYRINPAYSNRPSPSEEIVPVKQRKVDLAIAEIWERTKEVSLKRVNFLEQVVRSIKSTTSSEAILDEDLRQKALQNAHKLAGSLGTFGFEEGSRLARQIENLFQSEPDQTIASQVEPLVAALVQELKGQNTELQFANTVALQSSSANQKQAPKQAQKQPLLLIVDSDREATQGIVAEAAIQKIRTAIASDFATAWDQLQRERPDVVLIDPFLLQVDEQTLLADLAASTPLIPVLVFSAHDRSVDRVAAVKFGGHMFLPKQTPPVQVLQAVVKVLQQSNRTEARVLAVDDDPQILVTLKALLEPQGIQLTCLEDPSEFWETLISIQPDLLILDVNMPEISGFDLCQSVRQDFQWSWLPVLFLTAQTDDHTQERMFVTGADDYLTKPIFPSELSARVFNRLKRSRSLRSQAEFNTLPGTPRLIC